MAITVNIHEAKTHFSKLLARVVQGEKIIICKSGKPVARLEPILEKPVQRVPGSAKGKVVIGQDFDAPFPDHILDSFEQ